LLEQQDARFYLHKPNTDRDRQFFQRIETTFVVKRR
jgi:hypothetical protein